jgi:hypothetical protein
MNDTLDIRAEGLIDEITRYLAAVELFRSLSCTPHWRAEAVDGRAVARENPQASQAIPRLAH